MNRSIYDLRTPLGFPRFFPRGRHPATAGLRSALRLIDSAPRAYGLFGVEAAEVRDYYVQRLADFEAGQEHAKRQMREVLYRQGQLCAEDALYLLRAVCADRGWRLILQTTPIRSNRGRTLLYWIERPGAGRLGGFLHWPYRDDLVEVIRRVRLFAIPLRSRRPAG